MTECVVICRTCRTNDGSDPKRWDWLCEPCAEECADNHRTETGHDVELTVVQDESMLARLVRDETRYARLSTTADGTRAGMA